MRNLEWKRQEVMTLARLAREKPVVLVASIREIPANQFQRIRRELRGEAVIRVSKKTLISRAFKEAGKDGLDRLAEMMEGEVALLFADNDPFKLYRRLEAMKVPAPAKPGHRPPEDVWVRKGETPFPPGPIVSQLQKVGIPARIERGRVVILEDTLFVKAGEQVDRTKAEILSTLGIEPMRVGLDVICAYQDGLVLDRSALSVDEEELAGQLSLAAAQAFNLAFNAAIPTDLTIAPLIQKAHGDARLLSVSVGFPTAETAGDILSLAQGKAMALASVIVQLNPQAVPEDLREAIGASAPTSEPEEPEEGAEEKEAEEEKEEEEESVGLGALFG